MEAIDLSQASRQLFCTWPTVPMVPNFPGLVQLSKVQNSSYLFWTAVPSHSIMLISPRWLRYREQKNDLHCFHECNDLNGLAQAHIITEDTTLLEDEELVQESDTVDLVVTIAKHGTFLQLFKSLIVTEVDSIKVRRNRKDSFAVFGTILVPFGLSRSQKLSLRWLGLFDASSGSLALIRLSGLELFENLCAIFFVIKGNTITIIVSRTLPGSVLRVIDLFGSMFDNVEITRVTGLALVEYFDLTIESVVTHVRASGALVCRHCGSSESRQHDANMPRQLVKVLERTSWTKIKAANTEGNTKEARKTRLPTLIRKLNDQ
ncbi:hypothetical protein KCU62_g401, partial [Aureobasidium sp. EXF-3399]